VNFVLVEQPGSSDPLARMPLAIVTDPEVPSAPRLATPAGQRQEGSVARPFSARTPGAAMPALAVKNRRWSQRDVFHKAGVIGTDALGQPLQCTVLDISKNGAQLEPSSGALSLPDCFTLVFYTNRIRSEANCVVRWRAGNKIGVCIAGPVRTCVERRIG
jgi:hypothetical protein